jgi:DNA-binding HxlR family transcriptional regulator
MINKGIRKTKDFNPNNCPVTHCINFIGGKWKPIIICKIRKNCNRYSLLKKAITAISKQTLTNQLRELEMDGIIERTIYPEIPPRVEYKISEFGQSLFPIFDAMDEWGSNNMKKNNPAK